MQQSNEEYAAIKPEDSVVPPDAPKAKGFRSPVSPGVCDEGFQGKGDSLDSIAERDRLRYERRKSALSLLLGKRRNF